MAKKRSSAVIQRLARESAELEKSARQRLTLLVNNPDAVKLVDSEGYLGDCVDNLLQISASFRDVVRRATAPNFDKKALHRENRATMRELLGQPEVEVREREAWRLAEIRHLAILAQRRAIQSRPDAMLGIGAGLAVHLLVDLFGEFIYDAAETSNRQADNRQEGARKQRRLIEDHQKWAKEKWKLGSPHHVVFRTTTMAKHILDSNEHKTAGGAHVNCTIRRIGDHIRDLNPHHPRR